MSPEAAQTICLSGEIDVVSVRGLAAGLSEAVGDRSRELIVDARRVVFIDSTGLGTLIRAAEQLRNQGRRMQLWVTADGPVARLLETTGMADRFTTASGPPGTG